MSSIIKNEKYLHVLDSWRGICALLTVLYHMQITSHVNELNFVKNSWIFVDFFFVLSGFIISKNYEEKLQTGYSLIKFITSRLARIYPLHLFMLILYITYESLPIFIPVLQNFTQNTPFSQQEKNIYSIFTNIFLIQSLNIQNTPTWNGPSWSISVEFWCYILLACTLKFKKN